MAGNKTDNGVHEVGTDDILASYQADTPGEIETSYLKNVNKAISIAEKKKKEQVKAHFSMIFDNPLQGYPYNEQYGFDKTLEEKAVLNTGEQKKINMAIQKATGSKEVDNEGDKFNAGSSMDIDVKKDSDGDFEIEFNYGTDGVEHLETGVRGFNNLTKLITKLSKKYKKKLTESVEISEGKMGEIYAAIQMGYTAKELNDEWGMGLATAKSWIREYWAAKKANRGSMKKESVDITEGTWAVPDSMKKITQLNDLMKKPHPMKKPKDADTAWKKFANLVGDDGVADAWYFQGEDGEGDARDPIVDWLGGWGFKVAGYRITHAPGSYVSGFDDDDRDSAEVEEGFFQNMWKKIKNKGKIKKPKGKDAKAVKV